MYIRKYIYFVLYMYLQHIFKYKIKDIFIKPAKVPTIFLWFSLDEQVTFVFSLQNNFSLVLGV